jgi:hypothetical protein
LFFLTVDVALGISDAHPIGVGQRLAPENTSIKRTDCAKTANSRTLREVEEGEKSIKIGRRLRSAGDE